MDSRLFPYFEVIEVTDSQIRLQIKSTAQIAQRLSKLSQFTEFLTNLAEEADMAIFVNFYR